MHQWYRNPDVTFLGQVDPADEFATEKHQSIRRNYAAMVENIDRWLGRFRGVVDGRGETENSLVVFAADHGEMLGDPGWWYTKRPYQRSLSVPFAFAAAGSRTRDVVVQATVVDLHATFCRLRRGHPRETRPAHGQSEKAAVPV